jgi:hypothetical protein
LIVLILISLISAFCFSNKKEVAINARIFIVPTILFQLANPFLDGMYFYLSGGLMDFFILYLFNKIGEGKKLLITLSLSTLLSIIINYIGWVIYIDYMEPYIYDQLYIYFYSFVFIVFCVADTRTNSNFFCVYSPYNERH